MSERKNTFNERLACALRALDDAGFCALSLRRNKWNVSFITVYDEFSAQTTNQYERIEILKNICTNNFKKRVVVQQGGEDSSSALIQSSNVYTVAIGELHGY